MKSSWFEVSKEGLRELQAGKPKHFIARELIQNAWDEQIKTCLFNAKRDKGMVVIEIEDDNPAGFQDLSDAFTLFKTTTKRSNPSQRGRFNIGEKQVLSMCERAEIATTKGTVIFDKKGRRIKRVKRESGSKISVWLKMAKRDFEEIVEIVKKYLVPSSINFLVNGEKIAYRKPYKIIQTSLLTEREINGVFVRSWRKTAVNIHKANGQSMLYELGLPVTEIDCQFSIDVQQKVPLSIDRDTVPVSYLKTLYAEVLNTTSKDVESENSSNLWVRQGMADKRIKEEVVKEIVRKRYGEKVVVANPFDPISIDDALASGYKVIHGAEMSKEEWENTRKAKAIKTSTELFGHGFADVTAYEPTEDMKKVEVLAKKIAKRLLGIDLQVSFVRSSASNGAEFSVNTLTFNVSRLGKKFFEPAINQGTIDLIIHELGHHAGHHTEKSYHKLLTKMAGQLVILALEEATFYKV